MSYDKTQFRALLNRILPPKLHSESAIELLLGTAAQESAFGTYLRQFGKGPARGAFQMEGMTFGDLVNRYSDEFPEINNWKFEELEWDLRKAAIMARIKYYSCPGRLPLSNDLVGMARYWKRWYNTPLGCGTIEEFIENYLRYVE